MLSLPTSADVARAKELFAQLSSEVYDAVDTRSLVASFAGLSTFDDPASTRVVFSAPQFEGDAHVRMQRLINVLVRAFKGTNLLDPTLVDASSVTLHATMVNTKYADGKPFNAKAMVGDARATKFGSGALREVHLSNRRERDENGFYKCEERIILP